MLYLWYEVKKTLELQKKRALVHLDCILKAKPSVSNKVVTMFDNQASECFFSNMVVTMFDRFKIIEIFS